MPVTSIEVLREGSELVFTGWFPAGLRVPGTERRADVRALPWTWTWV